MNLMDTTTERYFKLNYGTGKQADQPVHLSPANPNYADVVIWRGATYLNYELAGMLVDVNARPYQMRRGRARFFRLAGLLDDALRHIAYPARSWTEQRVRDRNQKILETLIDL